jgi:hypothetical protein
MSEYYNNIADDIKQNVIKVHVENQEMIKVQKEVLEDYNNYIASYEYEKSLKVESICEDIEAYDNANGNYYELIHFYLHEFVQSLNYKKYIYLRFYNNIRSDVYYSLNNEITGITELNIANLVAVLNDSDNLSIFNNNYNTKETKATFSVVISKRIIERFTIYNYYRNGIKHPYKYKSNIHNYLIKDFLYDYTNILDQHIILSPCEYDDIFLNNISIYNSIATDTRIIDSINNNIYSIDFETFVDLSFIIKYYDAHFSRDGTKTLHTFYSDKMRLLVIPELYKVFLNSIKNSKTIYEIYEKTKYIYCIDMDEEFRYLCKDLCPNVSGLIFIYKCNYIYKLWRLIFNSNKFFYHYYPDKLIVNKINDDIITGV